MFFDYDGYVPVTTDDSLMEMIEFFANEIEEGKLYISYPMVESLKHLKKSVNFKETFVDAKENIIYKKLVSKSCENDFQNLTTLTLNNWCWLIEEHLKKSNLIVNGGYLFPKNLISQRIFFFTTRKIYYPICSSCCSQCLSFINFGLLWNR